MLRHLQRFAAAGHRISVIGEWGQSSSAGWTVHHLPHRRFWWPPFGAKDGALRSIRMRLWAGECDRLLGAPPEAVLTYLSYHSELLSEVAAHYARRRRLPLTTIVHDDVAAFRKGDAEETRTLGRRYRWIMAQAQQNWFVSPELAQAYGFGGGADSVLLPIPEGAAHRVEWREDFSHKPLVIYAGFIHEPQLPLLARLGRIIDHAGGHLMLLARESPALRDLCAMNPITLKGLLPSNREALDFVAAHGAAFLAAYCERIEDMPWIRSSFPSKVVEFSHVGLPLLFVAPAGSAIHRWNAERQIAGNFAPDQEAGIAEFIVALKDPKSWDRLARQMRGLAASDFDPAQIHQRLTGKLA